MRGDRSVPSDREDRHDEDAPKGSEPGEEATEVVASGGEDGVYADYANVLPSALACFKDDFEACIAHLRLPVTHRCFARTTNLLERLFVEERRRLKIIPTASAKSRCSSSCSACSSGLRFTEFELRQIAAGRKELDDEYQTSITPLARSAQPRASSKSKP